MRAKQQEAVKRQAVATAARTIAGYQKIKHEAGLIADRELGASPQSLLAAQNDMQRAESEAVARMQQLANLLGSAQPEEAWKTSGDIPFFDVPAFDDTPLDVLRNRPDIRKAEACVLAAAGEFELSKSDMYPKLVLSGNLSQLDNLTGTPLMGKTVQLTGMPSLSLPLFDWGKRLSAARVKDEKLSEQASAYRETVIGAMNEVEEFWSAYRLARAVEKSSEENTRIARKASEHAGLLFKQGASDGIAAETAGIDAAGAAIAELQAKADSVAKLTALTKALGGASPPSLTGNPHD
jgi:outer membrane protein TolC